MFDVCKQFFFLFMFVCLSVFVFFCQIDYINLFIFFFSQIFNTYFHRLLLGNIHRHACGRLMLELFHYSVVIRIWLAATVCPCYAYFSSRNEYYIDSQISYKQVALVVVVVVVILFFFCLEGWDRNSQFDFGCFTFWLNIFEHCCNGQFKWVCQCTFDGCGEEPGIWSILSTHVIFIEMLCNDWNDECIFCLLFFFLVLFSN